MGRRIASGKHATLLLLEARNRVRRSSHMAGQPFPDKPVEPLDPRGRLCPACQALLGADDTTCRPCKTLVPVQTVRLPTPSRLPELPGYEVLDKLGEGGMGVVYKARQLHPGRVVAVKMILAGLHAGTEHVARFLTEMEAVGG